MAIRLICSDESLVDGPPHLGEKSHYRIGRSSKCTFVLNDLSVSRFHAEMTIDCNKIRVRDLGSRNGTFIDGVRIAEESDIQPGQSVRFGTARFKLVDDAAISLDAPEELSGLPTECVKNHPSLDPNYLNRLSGAQRRVLDLLLKGEQEKEVANHLGISQNTVHNHVKSIYQRLSVNSRAELLALFILE